MSNQSGRPSRPALDIRGAVDLSALANRRPAPSTGTSSQASSAPAPSGVVIDVTDATFVDQVVQRSTTVPVLIDFWAEWCQPCKQLSPILDRLAAEHAGAFLLAKVDLDANPQLAQAFQVQSIPAVFAVLKGQPIPLFQGAQPEAQIRTVIAEVLKVAAANGVTGTVETGGGEAVAEPVEEALPEHLVTAYDAVDRGDFPAAITAFESALAENPADDEARLGLAQVRLLERTQGVDTAAVRAAAASRPQDVDAQTIVADVDVLGGHVEDAFSRLVEVVRATSGADRERARAHLLGLFEVVGTSDQRVVSARLALANALF
jgi:putative thioredoxin